MAFTRRLCQSAICKKDNFLGNTMATKSPVGEAAHPAAGLPEVPLESLIINRHRRHPANIRYHPIMGATRHRLRRRHLHRIRHICILREDLS